MCRVVLNPITSVKRYREVAPDAGHTCDSCAFSALQWAWACMLFFTLEDHEFQRDTHLAEPIVFTGYICQWLRSGRCGLTEACGEDI